MNLRNNISREIKWKPCPIMTTDPKWMEYPGGARDQVQGGGCNKTLTRQPYCHFTEAQSLQGNITGVTP